MQKRIGFSYQVKSLDRASVSGTFRQVPAPDWALGLQVTITGWFADGHTAVCSIIDPEFKSGKTMLIHEDDLGLNDGDFHPSEHGR